MPRPALLVLLLAFSGCFPHSCSRTNTRALLPADSLSRAIAEGIEEETLEFIGDVDLSDVLEHPRTLLFDEMRQQLYVADTRANRVLALGMDLSPLGVLEGTTLSHPYLAGRSADTIAVLQPAANRIELYVDRRHVRSIDVDMGMASSSLTYALLDDDRLFYKVVEEGGVSRISRLNSDGEVQESHDLPGPHWRHAGMMRMWDDTLVSLSGYRPVVDLVLPDGRLDSMALQGFDSPMLPRSGRFIAGDVSDAPLLTSSADPAGDFLFVLNLRAGWIQIDAYDRAGMLRHILTEPDPQPGKRFFPVDIAAERVSDGEYDLFVLLVQPVASILHFRAHITPQLTEASSDPPPGELQ